MMRNIFFVLVLAGLPSCGPRVWVVATYADRGVIGYSGGELQEVKPQIESLIHCAEWEFAADEPRSQEKTYTAYENIETQTQSRSTYRDRSSQVGVIGGTTTTSTTRIPVERRYTSYWREFTYLCKDKAPLPQR